jgi:hypothetical protein
MLVPIVILLVMAPTSTKALPIDLLKVAEGASESRDHAVMISPDAHGQSAVDGRQITANQREPVVNGSRRMATALWSICARTRTSHLASLPHYLLDWPRRDRACRARRCQCRIARLT